MLHRVVLFTKPAIAGLVKTRLQTADGSGAPTLTGAQAASLHRAFLFDTSRTLTAACEDLESVQFEIAWALDGGHRPEPGFEHHPGFEQRGHDLGERLLHGLSRQPHHVSQARKRLFSGRDQRAVVIAVGSDHPELGSGVVEEAITIIASDSADVAIGPTEDGGYYLLGVGRDRLDRRLFEDVEWSSPRVFEQTLSRAVELGLRVHQLPLGRDCDTPGDLLHLEQRLSDSTRSRTVKAEATREWLRLNGWTETASGS